MSQTAQCKVYCNHDKACRTDSECKFVCSLWFCSVIV